MSAGSVAAPGTKYGPCDGPCPHRDCAASRAEAAAICRICGEPIGYNRLHYIDKKTGATHAVCEEKAIEAARKAKVKL